MSVVEITSKIGLEELIGELRQLDAPALDYLVANLQKEQAKRKQQPPKKMTNEDFWRLIEKADWTQADNNAILQPVTEALAQLSIPEIYGFSERLADLLHQLDGPDFIKSLEQDPLGYSADTFLYARCFAVAQGQAFYKKILSKITPLPTDYLEQLLYVASKAYQQKTGEKYNYIPSTIYESFFNRSLWGESAIVL